MSRFASIKTDRSAATPQVPEGDTAEPTPKRGREGKKAVVGYYSREVSRGLHLLAFELDVSLQALMGEAFDDLMRKYGKHPFGER